jgi:hypothetical protein
VQTIDGSLAQPQANRLSQQTREPLVHVYDGARLDQYGYAHVFVLFLLEKFTNLNFIYKKKTQPMSFNNKRPLSIYFGDISDELFVDKRAGIVWTVVTLMMVMMLNGQIGPLI